MMRTKARSCAHLLLEMFASKSSIGGVIGYGHRRTRRDGNVCVGCKINGETLLRELVDLESIDDGTSRDRISELGLRRRR